MDRRYQEEAGGTYTFAASPVIINGDRCAGPTNSEPIVHCNDGCRVKGCGQAGFNIRICQAYTGHWFVKLGRCEGGDDQGIDQGHNWHVQIVCSPGCVSDVIEDLSVNWMCDFVLPTSTYRWRINILYNEHIRLCASLWWTYVSTSLFACIMHSIYRIYSEYIPILQENVKLKSLQFL